jgi:OOP family OmpA-OmpF porin
MRIPKHVLVATTFAAVVAATPAVQAAGSNWYVGAGVGRSDLRGGAEIVDPNLASEGTELSLDDKDTGWKLFGGYQFNRYFSGEMIYAKFGKFSLTHRVVGGTATDEAKPDALCLAGVGTLPVGGKLSLLGKAGVCHWNDHPSESEPAGYESPGEYSSGTDPMYGVGASYGLNNRMSVRAEWERYHNVVHNRGDVDLLSVSFGYHF